MIDKVKYWIELSDYDLETARAMLTSKRYLYVGFMCHQTIEKIIKAYYHSCNQDIAPFSHSLAYLARKANLSILLNDDQKNFIDILEPLNIEARYPSHKEKILQSLSEAKCIELIEKTSALQQWIKTKL